MRQSSGYFECGLERRSGVESGPKGVHAPADASDDGPLVSFSRASLSVAEGLAVVVAERAEGELIEDTLDALAAGGPAREAGSTGLPQHRHPARAVLVPHSDDPRSLIDGRGELAMPKQHLNGRAA